MLLPKRITLERKHKITSTRYVIVIFSHLNNFVAQSQRNPQSLLRGPLEMGKYREAKPSVFHRLWGPLRDHSASKIPWFVRMNNFSYGTKWSRPNRHFVTSSLRKPPPMVQKSFEVTSFSTDHRKDFTSVPSRSGKD